mmetsp:Transcript_40448/g.67494  ORF Transcript_40448/g.67494 Transcript_40448/m.67494 type:complete len:612 (+) Transcript_40448:1170-3005(+)
MVRWLGPVGRRAPPQVSHKRRLILRILDAEPQLSQRHERALLEGALGELVALPEVADQHIPASPAAGGGQVKVGAQSHPKSVTLHVRAEGGLAGHRHVVDVLLHILIIHVHDLIHRTEVGRLRARVLVRGELLGIGYGRRTICTSVYIMERGERVQGLERDVLQVFREAQRALHDQFLRRGIELRGAPMVQDHLVLHRVQAAVVKDELRLVQPLVEVGHLRQYFALRDRGQGAALKDHHFPLVDGHGVRQSVRHSVGHLIREDHSERPLCFEIQMQGFERVPNNGDVRLIDVSHERKAVALARSMRGSGQLDGLLVRSLLVPFHVEGREHGLQSPLQVRSKGVVVRLLRHDHVLHVTQGHGIRAVGLRGPVGALQLPLLLGAIGVGVVGVAVPVLHDHLPSYDRAITQPFPMKNAGHELEGQGLKDLWGRGVQHVFDELLFATGGPGLGVPKVDPRPIERVPRERLGVVDKEHRGEGGDEEVGVVHDVRVEDQPNPPVRPGDVDALHREDVLVRAEGAVPGEPDPGLADVQRRLDHPVDHGVQQPDAVGHGHEQRPELPLQRVLVVLRLLGVVAEGVVVAAGGGRGPDLVLQAQQQLGLDHLPQGDAVLQV